MYATFGLVMTARNLVRQSGTTVSNGSPAVASVTSTSSSFAVTYSGLGEPLPPNRMSSASYGVESGFGSAYPPPGEVFFLRFGAQKDQLRWDAERSAGTYSVYRGNLSTLSDLQYGSCLAQDVMGTGYNDDTTVPVDDGFYYLVTVTNRLREEGSKGFQSDGVTERQGTVCP